MTAPDLAEAEHPAVQELDDLILIDLARKGCPDAYAALYDRHAYGAHRLARHLGMRDEADDVVSESFAQVLELMQRGKGPQTSFRAYLFTTIRHEAGRRAKARQKVLPTDDDARIDSAIPFGADRLDAFETSAIRGAYESLPERWRTVVWHLDVEGRKPHELAEILDLSPNAVSALVYRARSALRQAYLQQHVKHDSATGNQACQDTRDRLSALVRRTLSERAQQRVHAHLQDCSACMSIYLELEDTNVAVAGATRAG